MEKDVGDYAEVVKILIANGANVNVKIQHRITPLHWAAYIGHPEIAKMLIANGANVNAISGFGNTPLDVAAKAGYQEIARMLIANGAHANNVKNAKDEGKSMLDHMQDLLETGIDAAEVLKRQ